MIRPGDMNPEIFQLNAESPDALILGDQFALQAHDTVFVGTAGVTPVVTRSQSNPAVIVYLDYVARRLHGDVMGQG